MKRSLGTVLALVPLALSACGSPPPPTQAGATDTPPPTEPAPAPTPAAGGPGQAQALVLSAASCWYGGLWSDAEGASPDDRRTSAEKRCMALVKRLYGSESTPRYDQLRVVDPTVVDQLAAEVDKLAQGDPADASHKDALGRLFRALAAAQRENNQAHVAADTVKADLKAPIDPDTLSKDEVAAVKPLRARASLEALFKLDAGDLSPMAHAMGLLCAMDRMELARGLPKHLKVYAVSDAYQIVFGVAPPQVPTDATAKLVPGVWLGYLTDVARAAGHAVPDKATLPREREPWAWGGVIAGFGDKLKALTPGLPPPFAKVAGNVTKKLDAEWAEIPEIAERQKAMAEREQKDKDKGKGEKPKK